jgi:Ca2+/Na+ antiporter
MVNELEIIFSSGFASVVGSPVIEALLLIGFFGAFVMLQNTRLEGKLCVLVPAILLSLLFVPFLVVFLAIGIAYLAYSTLKTVFSG